MELPGKRKRGRPKRRFMDVVKDDMAEVDVTEEDTVDRNNWRRKIRCGDRDGKSRKKRKKCTYAIICIKCAQTSVTGLRQHYIIRAVLAAARHDTTCA